MNRGATSQLDGRSSGVDMHLVTNFQAITHAGCCVCNGAWTIEIVSKVAKLSHRELRREVQGEENTQRAPEGSALRISRARYHVNDLERCRQATGEAVPHASLRLDTLY